MATFGKLNFAVAFNPQTAFPLDARTYFSSYNDALSAAQAAVEVGSSDGIYYFGQTLTVVEENKAKFYIIQPDKTLSSVGGDEGPVIVGINAGQFEYVDNKLTLKDSATATDGQVLSMDGNGNLAWVTPVDAYSKDETNSKITEAVLSADHLKRKIVDSVEAINKDALDALQYIYMVPNGLTADDDRYDEYLVIEITGDEGSTTRFVEKVGTWAVDLADYAKKTELDNYVKKNGTNRLITEAEGEKIAESEKNVINSVDTAEFSIDEDRTLSLKIVPQAKVDGLVTALAGKVDSKEGYTLLSPTDQNKLAALTIGDSGSLEVSGKVNASNVTELDQWIEDNRNTVNGLLSEDEETKLSGLYDTLGAGLTVSVIDDKKQLAVSEIAISQVTNLESELNAKAAKTDFEAVKADFEIVKEAVGVASTDSADATGLHKAVEDIADELNNYVLQTVYAEKMSAIDVDIADLKSALTWKDIT